MRETWVQSLGREDPLKKEMETHSSTLAWKIPWTEECGGLQSMGKQRARQDWATSLSLFTCLKCSLGISSFLEEISSLSQSIVFLYIFAVITEEDFLISLAILWNSVFKWVYPSFSPLPLISLLFTAICKASSDNHFAFLHFFFLGMILITDSCTNLLNLFATYTV